MRWCLPRCDRDGSDASAASARHDIADVPESVDGAGVRGANLLIAKVAECPFPSVVKHMLQAKGPELIDPDAVVVGELGLWTYNAHGQPPIGKVSAQGKAGGTAAGNADVNGGCGVMWL